MILGARLAGVARERGGGVLRRRITIFLVTMLVTAMMAVGPAWAGADGSPTTPGGFDNKKECKRSYKYQGLTGKEAKQTCKQIFNGCGGACE